MRHSPDRIMVDLATRFAARRCDRCGAPAVSVKPGRAALTAAGIVIERPIADAYLCLDHAMPAVRNENARRMVHRAPRRENSDARTSPTPAGDSYSSDREGQDYTPSVGRRASLGDGAGSRPAGASL
jgi:hypothetical protein